MIPSNIGAFDAMLSLLAALALWPVVVRLWRAENLTPLENRLRWIYISLFSLLVLRVPYMGYGKAAFGAVTYVTAMMVSFSVFLYFETLLRRHMPLWLKIYASLGSVVLAVDAFLGRMHGNFSHLMVFGLFLLSQIFFVTILTLLRDKDDYSEGENQLISLALISLWFYGPFFLSDVTTYGIDGLPRLGSVGVCIFSYLSLYNQTLFDRNISILKKVVKSFVFSFVLLYAVSVLIPSLGKPELIRLYLLFLVINLIFRIWYAVHQLDGEEEIFNFVRTINESDKTSKEKFLSHISDYFRSIDFKVLSKTDLEDHDRDGLIDLFARRNTHLFTAFEIQEVLADGQVSGKDRVLFEQLVDLMERHEKSYICLFGREEGLFVVFNVYIVGYRGMIELKTKMVAEISRLLGPNQSR